MKITLARTPNGAHNGIYVDGLLVTQSDTDTALTGADVLDALGMSYETLTIPYANNDLDMPDQLDPTQLTLPLDRGVAA